MCIKEGLRFGGERVQMPPGGRGGMDLSGQAGRREPNAYGSFGGPPPVAGLAPIPPALSHRPRPPATRRAKRRVRHAEPGDESPDANSLEPERGVLRAAPTQEQPVSRDQPPGEPGESLRRFEGDAVDRITYGVVYA